MRKYILRSEMKKRISKIWKSNPYETKMKAIYMPMFVIKF